MTEVQNIILGKFYEKNNCMCKVMKKTRGANKI